MSKVTAGIMRINQELDKISGLDGIVADKIAELEIKVKEMVSDILENHSEANVFNYDGGNVVEWYDEYLNDSSGQGNIKLVKKWFEDNDYEVDLCSPVLAKSDTILFQVVEPHRETSEKWLLRVAALTSFDRWANSTAVEKFFDTETDLCDYLENNQVDIYKAVLENLSEEYEETCKLNYRN